MKSLFIVTGTNRGLGKAICEQLLRLPDTYILSIGRKTDEDFLNDTTNFSHLNVDLSNSDFLSAELITLSDKINDSKQIIFINNAGSIEPITSIGAIETADLINSVNINAIAPAIICNYLMQNSKYKKLTFVNISSGAANRPIEGWATYCSGKAFTKMFFDVLAMQTKNNPDIKIKTIDPGVIDTSMQEVIRNANNHDFPEHPIFIQLNEEGKLRKPSDVAEEIIKEINV